jgi:ABC-2 type transport system ATP-binding protein
MGPPGRDEGRALVLSNVEVHYGPRSKVGPVSAELPDGAVLGLIGTNGSGKTSIMRAICGLQPFARGEITVAGVAVCTGTPVAGVGAMIEEPRFYPWLTATENLLLAAGGRRQWNERIASALAGVGLGETRDLPVGGFSQGMRQRLGLARAVLGQPRLLVLDEPTNGLDANGMAQMRALLAAHAAGGTAVVLSSHLIAEIEAMADAVIVLSAGDVVHHATTREIVDRWGSVSRMYEAVVAGL